LFRRRDGAVFAIWAVEHHTHVREAWMRKVIFAAAVIALAATGCKKTGEGEYEVQKPVVGTVTDTVHTPVVETGVDSTKVAVPKVEVKKDSATIKVPTVKIKKP